MAQFLPKKAMLGLVNEPTITEAWSWNPNNERIKMPTNQDYDFLKHHGEVQIVDQVAPTSLRG